MSSFDLFYWGIGRVTLHECDFKVARVYVSLRCTPLPSAADKYTTFGNLGYRSTFPTRRWERSREPVRWNPRSGESLLNVALTTTSPDWPT
eukprot:6322588-Pyramimonas_sp.AAC.6